MKLTWIFAVAIPTLIILVQPGSSLDASIRIPVLRQARQSDDQKPEVQKPDDQKPEVQKPDDQKPEVQKPDDQKPEIQKPEAQKPDDQKPVDQKPDVQKPEAQKPDDQKPEVQKPDDQKPEVQKPVDHKTDTDTPAKRPFIPLVDNKFIDNTLDPIDPLLDTGNGLELASRPKPPPVPAPAPPKMGRNGDYPDLPIANPTPPPPTKPKPDESDAQILPGGNAAKKPSSDLQVPPTPSGGYPKPSGGYPESSGGYPESSGGYPASIGGYSSPDQKYGPVFAVPQNTYGQYEGQGQGWPQAPYLQNSWSYGGNSEGGNGGWGAPKKSRKKGRKNKQKKQYGRGWPSSEEYWNSAEVELEIRSPSNNYGNGHRPQYQHSQEGQGHQHQYEDFQVRNYRQPYEESLENQGHQQYGQSHEGQDRQEQYGQSYNGQGQPQQYGQTGGGAKEWEWEDDNSNNYIEDWGNNDPYKDATPNYNTNQNHDDGGRKFDDGFENSNYNYNTKNQNEEISIWQQGYPHSEGPNYEMRTNNPQFRQNYESPNYGNHVQRPGSNDVSGMYGFQGGKNYNGNFNHNQRPPRAQNSNWPEEMKHPQNDFLFQSRLPSTSQLYESLGFNDLW